MITKRISIFLLSLICVFALSANAATSNQPAVKAAKNAAVSKLVNRKTGDTQEIVNLNTANVKSLLSLRGIGKKKAKAIVAYRDKNGAFKSVADLAKVKGISKKTVTRLLKNNPNRFVVKPIS